MAQAPIHNASMDNSLTKVLDRFERSLTLQNNAIQESLALSTTRYREHYLSTAKPCDGKDPKEFEHWLDDVQRLATLAKKSSQDVALATFRGSLHRHVRELHNNGSTWEAIKTQTSGNILWLWELNYSQTQVTSSQAKWHAYAWIHFKIWQSSGTCLRAVTYCTG